MLAALYGLLEHPDAGDARSRRFPPARGANENTGSGGAVHERRAGEEDGARGHVSWLRLILLALAGALCVGAPPTPAPATAASPASQFDACPTGRGCAPVVDAGLRVGPATEGGEGRGGSLVAPPCASFGNTLRVTSGAPYEIAGTLAVRDLAGTQTPLAATSRARPLLDLCRVPAAAPRGVTHRWATDPTRAGPFASGPLTH